MWGRLPTCGRLPIGLGSLIILALLPAQAQVLVFEHATVIDMTGAEPHKDFSVAIEGDRILAVAQEITPPHRATIIDARGKFLIPGLWDMHMHLGMPETFFPLLLSHGITGVREMYSGIPLPLLQQWRARPEVPRIVTSGFLDGPLMLTAGPFLPEPSRWRPRIRRGCRPPSGPKRLRLHESL